MCGLTCNLTKLRKQSEGEGATAHFPSQSVGGNTSTVQAVISQSRCVCLVLLTDPRRRAGEVIHSSRADL